MRSATDASSRGTEGIRALLTPASIAIIGVSANPSSIGGKPLQLLQQLGYRGAVHLVNPKYRELSGLPCLQAIAELPEGLDLAIVAVAASSVLEVLAQLAERAARSAVVFSGGFGEADHAGERLQDDLAALAKRSGLRVLGPNCQGLVNLWHSVPATFSTSLELPGIRPGAIALVSQSGAFGFSVFAQAQARGIGIGYVVTTGNEADVTASEVGEELLARDDVGALLMYVESIRDGRRFRAMAARARNDRKPIVLIKGGTSGGGRSAARSHTGALANDEAVFAAVCRDAGVCLVDTIAAACDLLHLLERRPGPARRARDPQPLAIASTSGGASVLAADECARAGMRLASFSPRAQDEVRHIVPRFGRSENPIDVTGQIINEPDLMEKVLSTLLSDDAVGGLLVLLTMVTGEQAMHVACALGRAQAMTQKLLVVAWTAPERMIADAAALLADHDVPLFDDPVRAVRALSRFHDFLQAAAPRAEAERATTAVTIDVGSEVALRRTLRAAGLPLCREEVVQSAEQGVMAAQRIGFPVVAKVLSPGIAHKSDVGLVRAPLTSADAVSLACVELLARAGEAYPRASIEGVVIQEFVTGVGEALVAIKRDPQFGPVLVLGTGGLDAEVWRDVVVVPLPATREEIGRALRSLRGYAIWSGARNRTLADADALVDAAVRTARLAESLGESLRVLEFNPVILREVGSGAVIVDVAWSA